MTVEGWIPARTKELFNILILALAARQCELLSSTIMPQGFGSNWRTECLVSVSTSYTLLLTLPYAVQRVTEKTYKHNIGCYTITT